MAIDCRVLEASDSAAYRAIRLEALRLEPQAFASRYEDAIKLEKMFFEKAIEESNPNIWVLGAFDEDRLQGIFAYANENSLGLTQTGSLVQMYVKKECRGQGLGMLLSRSILKLAFKMHSIDQIVLEVMPGNAAARNVYLKAGFSPVKDRLSSESEALIISRHDV